MNIPFYFAQNVKSTARRTPLTSFDLARSTDFSSNNYLDSDFVEVIQSGKYNLYYIDRSDSSSVDDGSNIIVAGGTRLKRTNPGIAAISTHQLANMPLSQFVDGTFLYDSGQNSLVFLNGNKVKYSELYFESLTDRTNFTNSISGRLVGNQMCSILKGAYAGQYAYEGTSWVNKSLQTQSIREGSIDPSTGINFPVNTVSDMSSYYADKSYWHLTNSGIMYGYGSPGYSITGNTGDRLYWNGGRNNLKASWDLVPNPYQTLDTGQIGLENLDSTVSGLVNKTYLERPDYYTAREEVNTTDRFSVYGTVGYGDVSFSTLLRTLDERYFKTGESLPINFYAVGHAAGVDFLMSDGTIQKVLIEQDKVFKLENGLITTVDINYFLTGDFDGGGI